MRCTIIFVAKTATAFDLVLGARTSGARVSRWLCDELRSAILNGRLRRGRRLPSTRELARCFSVSRGTVVTAFEQLHAEGYLESKTGRGTYVNTLLPEDLLHPQKTAGKRVTLKNSPKLLSRYAQRLPLLPPFQSRPARAFRAAEAGLDVFPLTLWAQISSRRLRRATRSLLSDADPCGYRPLREAIADYLGTARGLRCTSDQVIVVAGIQQGLDLTARIVLDPSDSVWVEDPCFPGVVAMFAALGATVIPVPVDAQGLKVKEGLRRCLTAKLAYVTPAHQFPLGPTMSLERRLELLDWANRSRALIFEDDYDSEYRYSGRPIPALQGQDRADSVLLAGSFSKLLFPSLRLGYLVVPVSLRDKFAAARFVMDRHSAVMDQAIMCDFIMDGHFGRHIRRMRQVYAERLAALRSSVASRIGDLMTIPNTEAGVQTVGWLERGLNAEAIAKTVLENNVEVLPLSRFAIRSAPRPGLLLGFGAVDKREILRGVDCLASALKRVGRRSRLSAHNY